MIARILEEEVVLSGYLVPAQVSVSTWPLHIQKCDYAHLFLTNAFVYHRSRRRSVFQGCTCVPRTTKPLMCRIRNTHGKKNFQFFISINFFPDSRIYGFIRHDTFRKVLYRPFGVQTGTLAKRK